MNEFQNITSLMDIGEPVCVTFDEHADGEPSDLLYCEMIQKARHGESFSVSAQGCPVGAYVLSTSYGAPHDYYLKSGRYVDMHAARCASESLPRVVKTYRSIRIETLSKNSGTFDVLILYLTPEKAMRIVQAHSYTSGARVVIDTLGAASVCGDCTALALDKGMGLSFGCKGSRKHSGYSDDEVPLGIATEFIENIEKGLKEIPQTWD
ncbi:MAG: DUF169 domain-containing protein [Methanosarcinaceae archaeon]|nr:DUF169 domain-containing protein [Methanosarcinaceae archaeon]